MKIAKEKHICDSVHCENVDLPHVCVPPVTERSHPGRAAAQPGCFPKGRCGSCWRENADQNAISLGAPSCSGPLSVTKVVLQAGTLIPL